MAWLGTWAKRRKITIPDASVDATDTLPIAIHLGTSVGIGTTDVTDIFDDLGANSKKIALTTSDGTTEVEVEIERWDNANEKTTLWARVTVTNGGDTELYLYWDPTEGDNSNIKDAGAATTIWPTGSDEEYLGVYLMGQASGTIIDSTQNSTDSVDETLEAYQVDGVGGRGYSISFEPTDYVDLGDLGLEANDLTIICAASVETVVGDGVLLGLWPTVDVFLIYARNQTPDRWRALIYDNAPKLYDTGVANTSMNVTLDTWIVLAMMYAQSDADGFKVFNNTLKEGVNDASTDAQPIQDPFPADTSVSMGAVDTGTGTISAQALDGQIAYMIIASTAFTDAMYDLFYHSFTDTLSTWSATENYSVGGWDHSFLGVAGASIGYVNDVAIASIGAINEVAA